MRITRFTLALAISTLSVLAFAQSELLSSLKFRGIGPAVTGGRIIDVEGHALKPGLVLAGAANGGVWRSVNNGTTWTPVFDNYGTISIGDIATAPSDPNIVWVGTGEHNNQRSCHWGDGVYKSTDGGVTFTNMGLKDSWHIGRIAVHPKDPNTVYVAAQGPLYRSGGERGMYKTTDGGKTWNQVLKGENDTTGFIEVAIDPQDPNTVYAGAMDRLRRAWNIREIGTGGGLYKSSDAGKSWSRVTEGLPAAATTGRIGLAIYPKDSKIVYCTIDNKAPATGPEVYRSNDKGKTWAKVGGRYPGGYYYGQIRVDPTNPERIYVLGVQAVRSDDGGKTTKNIARNIHVDHHGLWINPANPESLFLGNDGGLHLSYDSGETFRFLNNLPIPQFYAMGVDMAVPYNLGGGLQDNGVWWGPSRTRMPAGIPNEKWIGIYGGDGFYTLADPEDANTVYTSSQFGAVGRVDLKARRSQSIRPREAGQRANWMAPFLISPHNSLTLYWCSQKVYKSTNRGDSWAPISGDLTTNNPEKLRGNVPHCTITTVDESRRRAGVIWAGTDDGNVWVTQNDGAAWTQVNGNISGIPSNWWVSRVLASNFDEGTAFVTFTGYREDDTRALIFKTTDFGKTWVSIASNLPSEPISVVREDTINRNLLVVGTELGCYITLNGGGAWTKLSVGIPTSACQDVVIHPRDGDLIVATHGRGIYIMNITPLRQLTDEVLSANAFLFRPDTALRYDMIANMFDDFSGDARYVGQNPSAGSTIYYYLKSAATGDVKIEILDADGKVLQSLDGKKEAGIQSVNWNLRQAGGGNQRGAPFVAAGRYGVRLTVNGQSQTQQLRVEPWNQ